MNKCFKFYASLCRTLTYFIHQKGSVVMKADSLLYLWESNLWYKTSRFGAIPLIQTILGMSSFRFRAHTTMLTYGATKYNYLWPSVSWYQLSCASKYGRGSKFMKVNKDKTDKIKIKLTVDAQNLLQWFLIL